MSIYLNFIEITFFLCLNKYVGGYIPTEGRGKMKKINGLLLSSCLLFGLASCGSTKTYSVVWNLNYSDAPVWAPTTVKEGMTLPEPANPTRDHYIFKDWYTEADCKNIYNFTLLVGSNLTLYAGWTATHTVSFSLNYENAPVWAPTTVADGTTVSKPTDPTRDSFTFEGWYTEAACTTEYNFTLLVITDLTLYAKWEADVPSSTFTMGPAKNNSHAGETLNVSTESLFDVTPDETSSVKRNAKIGVRTLENNSPAQFGTSANDYWIKTKRSTSIEVKHVTLTLSAYNFLTSPYGGVVWMQINYTLSAGETGKPYYTVNYEPVDYASGTKLTSTSADGQGIMRIFFDKCVNDVFINSITFKVIVPNT